MISVCLLIFALVDYLVPILTSVLCNAQSWTGQKEKKLIEICQNLSSTMLQVQGTWASISKIRHDRPNIVSEFLLKIITYNLSLKFVSSHAFLSFHGSSIAIIDRWYQSTALYTDFIFKR